MGLFYIDTTSGHVATLTQLVAAGVTDASTAPQRPWHPLQGTRDASTMWYAVMRKEIRDGVFIGALCLRHSDHHASLLHEGYQEVAVDQIGISIGQAAPGAAPPAL
jgi:hypothetical protein